MKLSKLYCNDKNFKTIEFKSGFNAIIGYGNKLNKNDSHNLGKTSIIKLIDYMLLKEVSKDKDHFLNKKEDFFKGYEFFLEIESNNSFFTIKRTVGSNKVSIKKHDIKYQNFVNEEEWDIKDLTLTKAKKEIDIILNFDIESNYRKFLKFILRTQKDYDFVFRKHEVKDKDWKPYIMEMLGYNFKNFEEVFKLKGEKEKIKEQLSDYSDSYFEKLAEKKDIKEIYESKIKELEEEVGKYDYYKIDESVNDDLIKKINIQISQLNKIKYNLTFDIESIKSSLNTGINTLDLEEIGNIYSEVSIYFNETLKKDYQSLLKFNQQISKERIENLNKVLVEKEKELEKVNLELINKNKEQKKYFEILENNKIISKILLHNNKLNDYKIKYAEVAKELEIMENNIQKNQKLKEKDIEINDLVKKINLEIDGNKNLLKENISNNFIEYTKNIFFDSEGRISIYKNKEGFPEIEMKMYSLVSGKVTAEDSGNNYNKHMKCCFDLAVIIGYILAQKNYFKFVFHDGSIESSDNKLKVAFLNLINELCEKYNIQYITTAIFDEISNKEVFDKITDKNIILKLDDSIDYSGTLFGKRF